LVWRWQVMCRAGTESDRRSLNPSAHHHMSRVDSMVRCSLCSWIGTWDAWQSHRTFCGELPQWVHQAGRTHAMDGWRLHSQCAARCRVCTDVLRCFWCRLWTDGTCRSWSDGCACPPMMNHDMAIVALQWQSLPSCSPGASVRGSVQDSSSCARQDRTAGGGTAHPGAHRHGDPDAEMVEEGEGSCAG